MKRRYAAIAVASCICVVLAASALATGSTAESASQETVPEGIFEGDFEVPSPGWQQYSGLQAEDDRPDAESFALVTQPVRQGAKAGRFTAQSGFSMWGHNEDTEVVLFGGEKEGDEYWYAWSTQFPRNWEAPHKWGIFAQWHARLGTSPIISLNARGDTAQLNVLTGLTDEDANRTEVNRQFPILSTLSKGLWNDFLLHVRWTTKRDGVVELYHRVEGSKSMRRVAYVHDVPTFQFTREGKGIGTYLLLGIYRGSTCPQPTELSCSGSQSTQPPSVVYHDGFTRARTFEEAARRAFPGQLPTLAVGAQSEPTVAAAPLALSVRSTAAGRVVEGRATLVLDGRRLVASVPSAKDTEDTAVATFRVRQRGTIVIRQRLRLLANGPLSGNAVVSQLRDSKGKRLVEIYVSGSDRMISVYSPPGSLLPGSDVNVSSGVPIPASGARTVELRLTPARLVLIVDGKVRNQLVVRGPARGGVLTARIGVDHYDGRGGDPLRVVGDRLEVGTAG